MVGREKKKLRAFHYNVITMCIYIYIAHHLVAVVWWVRARIDRGLSLMMILVILLVPSRFFPSLILMLSLSLFVFTSLSFS